MSESTLLTLCQAAEVSPGAAKRVETAGLVLAVFNLDGEYYVTDDTCTHGPGSLSEGFIEDDCVECDFHNGAFNIKTGQPTASPCTLPLRTYAVAVVDGMVCIDPQADAGTVIPIRKMA